MKQKLVLLIATAVALSGCAASYPRLMEGGAPTPAANGPQEIDTILAEAASLQNSYSGGYMKTAKWQDYSQLPLIGAAGWAALVLLNNKANAATRAGKIGIGAGVYSQARGQLTASGLPDAYIAGHGALTCVLAEGSNFAGQPAVDREQELDDQLQIIANRIGEVTALRWATPTDTANADALKAALAVADQAIANARTAETAALAQQGGFQSAAPVFRNAVSSISVRVASKGRVRPGVDFASLRDKFAPPKVAEDGAGQGVADGSRSDTTASIIERLMQATQALVGETARLTGGTPDYNGSLDRVRACPTLVG